MKKTLNIFLLMIIGANFSFSQDPNTSFKSAIDTYFEKLDYEFPAKYKIKTITIEQPEPETNRPYIAEKRHFDKTGSPELIEFFDINGGVLHTIRTVPDPIGKLTTDSTKTDLVYIWSFPDGRMKKMQTLDDHRVIRGTDVYEYDKKNNLISQVTTSTLDNYNYKTKYTTKYNRKNLPIEKMTFDSANKVTEKELMTYNKAGLLLSDILFESDGKVMTNSTQYEYSKENKLLKSSTQLFDNGKRDGAASISAYSYDSLGRLIQIDELGGENDNGIKSFTYDKNGNVLKITNRYPDEDAQEVEEFEYDKRGLVIKYSSGGVSFGVTTYTYNEKGLMTEMIWEEPTDNDNTIRHTTRYSFTFW